MKQAIYSAKSFLKKYDILRIGKNKKTTIFLFFCLIIGMICGAVSASSLNMESIYKLDFLFLNDFKERLQQSNIQIFTSSFFILSIFALSLELSALSCWGSIFIPLIIIFRGLGLGISAGYLYLIYGLKGIAFYLLILLPGIFISSVGLTVFASGCIKFSFKLFKVIFSHEVSENLWEDLKVHVKKSGYCLILLACASIVDVCFMIMFSRFFSF